MIPKQCRGAHQTLDGLEIIFAVLNKNTGTLDLPSNEFMFVTTIEECQLKWMIERRKNNSTNFYSVTIRLKPRRDSSAVLVDVEQLLTVTNC
jgi:hypothetical protein